MKKALNIALFLSFLLTILVSLTGVHIHKLASVLFLLLTIVHMVVYRRKLGLKRWLLLGLVLLSFVTGIVGMIFQEISLLMALHKVISMGIIFFLAIHIFIYRNKLK